ncbi:MAG: Mu-like prophage major head subunit gpT family protein [Oscillospiraceae bacterium]
MSENKVIFSMGSGLNDSLFGKTLTPVKTAITKNVEAFEEISMIPKVFYMDNITNYAEKYTNETSLGDFENVGENGAYPKTSMQEGYSKIIEPTTWKSSFEVTREMAEDNKLSKIKSRANIFTTSYNRTREKFAAGLIGGGTGTKTIIGTREYDTTGADGVALFSTAHPSITGGAKQSNLFKSAVTLDAFDKVQEMMQDFRDDDGNLLNVSPSTIIIPNSGALKRKILEVVGSEFNPESVNNAMNFQAGLWNVIIWNYLPKTIGGKPYFIMMDEQFKDDYMCLPFVDRVKLSVSGDKDPGTDALVFRGRARYNAGFNNWRCMALCGEGVTGTTITTV